jgi:hypothetical protein
LTDAISQDIYAVGRHEWATVGGEIHPQKPRFSHEAGSILRSRMHIRYFWTMLSSLKEKNVSFASFTWYIHRKREGKIYMCQKQDKREGGKRIG